ncbi:MAG: DNA gyrase subunit A [Thermoplasmata archaeon]
MTKRPIEEEIKTSYLEYAMSVIVSRAIPDVRDGLKPVQRRILHSMNELSVTHDKPYKKSARIVGETMGKYHPHGDTAIYESLARMAQDYSLRYTLIDGQGNFGSIDGDDPAAMRYTEVRMSPMAEELFTDIDKNTVPFRLNFDGSLEEPEYLPSKVPQLLLNGSSGIAVGMATNMLPHNLREICDAIVFRINNPESTVDDLLKFVKGPDFPTGGEIFYSTSMIDAYRTGRGKVHIRGEMDLSENKKIIVKSIPYNVNKSQLVEKIADLIKNEIINGITEIRDESDREGIRIVFRVKDEEMKPLVMKQLYAHSDLEMSIGIINLVLVNNQPVVLGLVGLIDHFINHRLSVILKRSQYDLDKNREKEHVLEGLVTALNSLDRTIQIIRSSRDAAEARSALQLELKISEKQANAILDLRLQRLTSLEVEKVNQDLEKLRKEISELRGIIDSEEKRRSILIEELKDIRKRYGDERRTRINYSEETEIADRDLIPEEQCVIVLSDSGFLKRVSLDEYRSQRRGGKGVITAGWKNDTPKSIVSASSHDLIYFFTNTGRVLKKEAYMIEKKSRTASGIIGSAILPLQEGETIKSLIAESGSTSGYVVMVTRNGLVKKIGIDEIKKIRDSGARVITLNDDEVVSVEAIPEDRKIFILSSGGKASLFESKEVRKTGRSSMGVRAMRLGQGNYVINSFSVTGDEQVLVVTARGIGKRTSIKNFPVHHRGTGGVMVLKENKRTGNVVASIKAKEDDELIIITKNEQTIRIKVSDIRELSRHAAGVRLISLEDDDRVIAVTTV